jgi:hypothetical protein
MILASQAAVPFKQTRSENPVVYTGRAQAIERGFSSFCEAVTNCLLGLTHVHPLTLSRQADLNGWFGSIETLSGK